MSQTGSHGAGSHEGRLRERPLSPHLQVYRLIPTMAMSIAHRLTGMALYAGAFVVTWWLFAAASGPDAYEFVADILQSWFGLAILIGFSWALLHHLLGGLRHLVWDTGHLMDKHVSTRLAWATIVGSVALTILLWLAAGLWG